MSWSSKKHLKFHRRQTTKSFFGR